MHKTANFQSPHQVAELCLDMLVNSSRIIVIVALFVLTGRAGAQEIPGCGNLMNAWGPKDYRTLSDSDKRLVETHHFNEDVESLKHGETGFDVGGDLDYTLRAIPNHPRALFAMSRLAQKEKTEKPRGTKWLVDCYFERAIAFQPDDASVHMIYGYHLLRKGKNEKAIGELEKAKALSGGSDANIHYNLGLAYLEVGRVDEAVQEAKVAYELGFPLPGLRDRLKKVGRWPD